MNVWFSYSLNVSIFMLVNYLMYSLLIADVRQPRFNRVLLWAIASLSFILPFAPSIPMIETVQVGAGTIEMERLGKAETVGGMETIDIMGILSAIYAIGFVVLLVYSLGVLLRLVATIHKGRRVQVGNVVIVWPEKKTAPFSWLNYIVLDRNDSPDEQEIIVEHERAHIRHGHSIDLAVATVVCIMLWYNPAVWLWRRQLAMVHEYEADKDVVESGVDSRQYQMLLIKKAVGSRLQSLANNLTHSKLKKESP